MHKLTINGSTSTQIKLGRYTTVLNLRKALQEVGYNVKGKACLIKQTHSSMPATLSWAARKVTHTWRPSSSVQKTIHQVGAGGCL